MMGLNYIAIDQPLDEPDQHLSPQGDDTHIGCGELFILLAVTQAPSNYSWIMPTMWASPFPDLKYPQPIYQREKVSPIDSM